MSEGTPDTGGRRALTLLGAIDGAVLALWLNLLFFHGYGEGYPVEVTTFVLFSAGAFAGMAIADRYGMRALRPLGLGLGVLLALTLLTLVVLMG
ncbi:MAG: hypothetical protein AAF447_24055 [Myxococcota bacterium]